MKKLAIIIPIAGESKKMPQFGPKSLIQVKKDTTLINRHLAILKELHPDAEIFVVVGYEADKVIKVLPSYVRVIQNERYDETATARSIGLALRATTAKHALIIYGNLWFTRKSIQALPLKESAIVFDKAKSHDEDVGATIQKKEVVHLDYGLGGAWTRILVLSGRELGMFKTIATREDRRRYLSHEIINEIIDDGGRFIVVQNKGEPVIPIKSPKDITKIKQKR